MSDAPPETPADPVLPQPMRPSLAQLAVGIVALAMAAAGGAAVMMLDLPEGKLAVVTGLLGYVFGWAGSVVSYYFGSSAGSAAKDASVTRLTGILGR